MTETQSEREDRNAELILKSISFCVGAVAGAVLGGVLGAMLMSVAHIVFGKVPYLPIYGGLAGALVGGTSSWLKTARQFRREAEMSEAADELGLDYSGGLKSDDAEDEVEEHLREMFSTNGRVSVGNMLRKEMGDASLVVAEVTQIRHSSHGSSSHSTTRVSTVAFFESPDLQWPTFTMQPEGKVLGLLAGMIGLQDIDFDDYPVFSDAYHLSGHHPEAVRALFTDELLQYFSDQHGLEVRASDNRLVMVRPGERCDPAQLESFVQQAMHIFGLLMDAAILNEEAIEAALPKGDFESQAEQMPGLMGEVLRSRLVTPEELESFLNQPPPRRVPANIARQRLGAGSLIMTLAGGIVALVGSGFAIYSIFYAKGPWNDDRIVPLVFGTVFPLLGYPACLLGSRYRYINRRLLRHGRVADGVVTKVESTGFEVDHQAQYRLTVEFQAEATNQQATVNAYGKQGREAKKLAENQAPIRVLYDPRKPTRVLWADGLIPTLGM